MRRQKQVRTNHNRKNLVEALARLAPALSLNNALDYTGLVEFKGDSIAAFDGEVGIAFPFDSGIRATLPAKPLIELLKKAKADEVTLHADGGELQITCGKLEAALTLSAASIPHPTTSDDGWEEIPEGYLDALEFASFSAAEDISKGILSCVRAYGNQVIGCDSYRLMRATIKGEFPEGTEFYVPAAKAKTISSHKPTHFKVSGGLVHLINEMDGVLSLMTMNGVYPDISSLLSVSGEEVALPSSELLRTLSTVEVLGEDAPSKGKKVMLTIETGRIVCSSESGRGRAKEEIKADCEVKEAITFFVNSAFLQGILPISNSLFNSERMLRFDGENFCYIACKMVPTISNNEPDSGVPPEEVPKGEGSYYDGDEDPF